MLVGLLAVLAVGATACGSSSKSSTRPRRRHDLRFVASRREARCRDDPDGDRRRPGQPLGRGLAGVQDRGSLGRRRDSAAQQQHGHLQELQRRSGIGTELPDGRRGQGHLRDRRVPDHRVPVRHLLEHGRSGREEPAPALRGPHESDGVAEVRLDRLLVGCALSVSTTPSPIPSGRKSRSTSGTSAAAPSSSTRSSTGRFSPRRRRQRARFKYVTYKVRLSPRTEQGMYDMSSKTPMRTASSGFVLPSNNEWVKAAYYDPKHGGTDSYWLYPTGPFNQPNVAVLNPTTGDVDQRDQAAARDLQPERPEQQRRHAGCAARHRPGLVPVAGRVELQQAARSIFHPGSISTRTSRAT